MQIGVVKRLARPVRSNSLFSMPKSKGALWATRGDVPMNAAMSWASSPNGGLVAKKVLLS